MVVEIGRIVYDINLNHVHVGDKERAVINNRLAISQGKDKTTFIDITAWGSNAEFLYKHFKKGNEIYIEGDLINKNTKRDNVEFETVGILVNRIKFTNGNPKNDDIPSSDDNSDFVPDK